MFRWEIDWRSGSMGAILATLDDSIARITSQEARDDDNPEGAIEQVDDLLGIGFVIGQTYISALVADVMSAHRCAEKNGVSLSSVPRAKFQLLQTSDALLAGTTVTVPQLCDAASNYYKHRDEWTSWESDRAMPTVRVLEAAGVLKERGYQCIQVAHIMGASGSNGLIVLARTLRSWRASVIQRCTQSLGLSRSPNRRASLE